MEIKFIEANDGNELERRYIAVGILRNFKSHQNVETHFFRSVWTEKELASLEGKGYVAEPDPSMPKEILANASEKKSLECLMEAFTREEAQELTAYLQSRYAGQLAKVTVCPLELPVPLGVGALNDLPVSERSGFIELAKAREYPLPFMVKGYYELPGHS